VGSPRWPQVFHDHYGFVHSVTRRLAGPQLDADDLTQEVFVVVHRKLDGLRDPERLRSWIYGICRRVVAHQRRKQRTRRTIQQALGTRHERDASTPEDETHQRQLELRLYEALDRLSPKRREALILFALEEMSGKQIAELLQIPVRTVWTRLHAARQDLLQQLRRVGIEPSSPLGEVP
jgi:RNA polymerase sigma-70 factor (ECF subfamily)